MPSLSPVPTALSGHVPLAVTTVGIVILALIALIALLGITGALAVRRREHTHRDEITAHIRAANQALAEAHAADEGWDRPRLESAAREAARAQGIADPDAVELKLVSVDDQPGVANDRAVFNVTDGDRRLTLTLGRDADGEWRTLSAG